MARSSRISSSHRGLWGWRPQLPDVHLTSRGWGILTSAIACVVAANVWALRDLYYIGCLLGALIVCCVGYVFVGHSRISVQRRFIPDVISTGEYSTARLEIRNQSALPSSEAQWHDRLPASTSIVGKATGELPTLGAGRTKSAQVQIEYRLRGGQRGEHPVGPLSISLPDPFGLVERKRAYGSTHILTVLPKIVALPPIVLDASGTDGPSHLTYRQMGPGSDDVIAREYVAGDPIRHLHWKATARRAELMVRQEERMENPRATVALNVAARDYDGAGDSPAFEWAVVQAASVCAALVNAGYGIAFRTFGASQESYREVGCDHVGDTIEDVLVDLARVGPGPAADEALAGFVADLNGVADRPLVAVLGSIRTRDAATWVTIGQHCTHASAIVDPRCDGEARSQLEDAGWTVLAANSADDLLDCWHLLNSRDGANA